LRKNSRIQGHLGNITVDARLYDDDLTTLLDFVQSKLDLPFDEMNEQKLLDAEINLRISTL
jgi:hypothetical protein